ncbi:phosphotransferase [Ursidibacter sp. B-7004-1]
MLIIGFTCVEIANSLAWLTRNRQQAVRSLQPLAGLTACSQMITLENNERYVLRTQSQRATNYGVNYQQEANLLKWIAPLNLSPKPLYCDKDALILEWIDGSSPTQFSPEMLTKLAQLLAKLHQFELQAVRFSPKSARLSLSERCQFLWAQLSPVEQKQLSFTPPFPNIEPLALAICHHDIHLANLIEQEDKLWLIDWEYSAISDPALELALFLNANPLSKQQQAVFFNAYFANSELEPTACMAKIEEYLPEVEKLNQLWFIIHLKNKNSSHL